MFKWVVGEVTFAFIGRLLNECHSKIVVKLADFVMQQIRKRNRVS